MTQMSGWQDKYLIAQTATISTAATFTDVSGDVGLDLNTFGIYLNSHPYIDPGQQFSDVVKTTGLSERVDKRSATGGNVEFTPAHTAPFTSFDFHATPKTLGLLFWILYQENVTEGGISPFTKTYIPAVGTTYEQFLSFARMWGKTAACPAIHGCVVTRVSVSGTTGEAISCTADLLGKTHVTNLDLSTGVSPLFSDEAPLMFSDLTCTLDGTATSINSFNIDFNVNHVPKYHNGTTVVKYVLDRATASGTINMPLSAGTVGDEYFQGLMKAGTVSTVKFSWGTPASAGHVQFELNVRWGGTPYSADDELAADLAFDAVYDASQSVVNSVKVTISDDVNRGV